MSLKTSVPVAGHPKYRIDRQGNVFSNLWKSNGYKWRKTGGYVANVGYPVVLIDGKLQYIHTLVLTTFVGPRPRGFECAHNNGNKCDPRLRNLRWATRKENAADCYKHGTMWLGEKHGGAKLKAKDIPRIRALAKMGMGDRKIGERFGVCRKTISKVRHGRTWSHIK